MYRVMVVDDEELIVEGLAQLFEELPGLQLEVYRAYSGYEAIDICKRVSIDIIYSDIRMPGMSGIELQQEVARYWPHCLFIFLTGYKDFDYIQAAIRNQGLDYILKTEDDAVIVESLRKAAAHLDQRFEMASVLARAKEQMQRATPLLQKEWLAELLAGKVQPGRLASQLEELGMPLDSQAPVLLMLGRIDGAPGDASYSDRLLQLYAVQNIAGELLGGTLRAHALSYGQDTLAWLIQPLHAHDKHSRSYSNAWQYAVQYTERMMEQIQKACQAYLKISLSLIAGAEPVEWTTVHAAFAKLRRILNIDHGLRQGVALSESSCASPTWTRHERYAAFQIKMRRMGQLQTFLETGQREQFFTLFLELARHLTEQDEEEIRLQFYFSVVAVYLAYLNQTDAGPRLLESIELPQLARLAPQQKWQDTVDALLRTAELIMQDQQAHLESRDTETIALIKRHIYAHLREDLSLVRLAELVGFNPSYLSRLYKQETGQGLSDFITQVKLERAKELLAQPHVKINEVSEALGFESPAYFTKFFKRATNLTPTDFRLLANT